MRNDNYSPLINMLPEIYSTTINGGITFTGNSLGLSKAYNSQDAGTANAIGAFMSTNSLLNVPTYPTTAGTTLNMDLNSSSAVLNLPNNSEVIHAELFWGGTYQVDGVNYIHKTKDPIKFTIPTSPTTTFTVMFDKFQQVNKTNTVGVYSCQGNVTSLVQQGLSGTYTVGDVLGTVNASNNSDNCCGWTLAVIYKNPTMPSRYINLAGGLVLINNDYIDNQIVGQFETPSSGNTNVRIALSAIGGDATIGGDQVLFGSNPNKTLTPLSGPKNAGNNFFASQINNDLGETDTNGTFGNRNQIINTTNNTGENIIAGRQGYDITNVDASNILKNSETVALIRYQTSSNIYVPNAIAFQIDVNSPNFSTSALSCGASVATTGAMVSYKLYIINTGTLPAENVILKANISPEMSFTLGSVIINGTSNSDSIITGISLGTVDVGEKVIVIFDAIATGIPKSNRYKTFANLTYNFSAPTGKVDGNFMSNIVYLDTTNYIPEPTINLTCNKDIVNVGNTIEYTILINNPAKYNAINPNLQIVGNKLPLGLSYNEDSLTLNNSSITGSIEKGITLPTLVPNTPIKIQFTANVTSNAADTYEYTVQAELVYNMNLPGGDGVPPAYETAQDYSNKLTIINNDYIVKPTISIQSNKTNTVVTPQKDNIEYIITISNPHKITISAVKLTDILPSGLIYKPNSLTINGNPSNFNLNTSITLGNILPKNSITVKFTANVNSMPSTGLDYPNLATASYVLNSPVGVLPGTITTNTIDSFTPILLTATINSNQSIIVIDKISNIEYTIKIVNPTSQNVTSAVLTDLLPTALQYIPNSITINGNPPDPPLTDDCLTKGVPLGNINSKQTIIVKFSTVATTEPDGGNFPNSATVKYNFSILGTNLSYSVNTNINNVISKIATTIQLNPLCTKNSIYMTYKNTPIKEKIYADNLDKSPVNSSIHSYPTNGYLKINPDNSWSYTPIVDFIGEDSFSILSTDKNLGSTISSITIIVKKPYDFLNSKFYLSW
ncbi:conserved repeat domain protein [Clostridium botulinum C str. Eklund]|nr:conserved repeat domain protein [Clostridium botulinum C str. Eklund]NEZ48851.1 DUF11 domain-containing protein [Clostridium botulinum]